LAAAHFLEADTQGVVFLLSLLCDTPAQVNCLEARTAFGTELFKLREYPRLQRFSLSDEITKG
jgi:hypothetical protein